LEKPTQVRLHLQRRAPLNLRHHTQRAVSRFLVLVVADLATFGLLRELIRAVRDSAVLGTGLAAWVRVVLPTGYLNGWQFAAALFVGLVVTGSYGPGDQRRDAARLFWACALASALPLWGMLWTQGLTRVSLQFALTTVLVWVGLFIERVTIERIKSSVRAPEQDALETLFVGQGEACLTAMHSPAFATGTEYRPIGFVDTQTAPLPGSVGHISEFSLLLAAAGAHVVVLCGYLSDVEFEDVVDTSLAAGCKVLALPRAVDIAGVHPTTVWRGRQPLVELSTPVVKAPALLLKRALDVFGASLGLAVFSPILATLAIAVKLDSRGPVFFASERWGRGGGRIRIWKFRTMVDGAAAWLATDSELRAAYDSDVKLRSDPRVTRVGKLLRRWSLDELPQLFNVLKGEMSLVGPRPKLIGEEARYSASFPTVLAVPPGMTGLWQVSGRNNVSYEERIALDVDYVRRCSLWLDIRLLLQTIPAVFGGNGAH
jgi:exopolysaccharide biosynthesis polyprenyl glycosylphosphotransferase